MLGFTERIQEYFELGVKIKGSSVDDLQLDYHKVQALLFHLFPVP
jgi:hypothetical protein